MDSAGKKLNDFDKELKRRSEKEACIPIHPERRGFNKSAILPLELSVQHIELAMNDFTNFIRTINIALHASEIVRLETMLMPANFSSIVGEFMITTIPKYCKTIVKNTYHNGHPDLLPSGTFQNNSIQHGNLGIEIKGSRSLRGWQGHNDEDCWLMVFCFAAGRPVDEIKNVPPFPFRFVLVAGAQLDKSDWKFSGRSGTSRRTITAAVRPSGYQKMMSNWIYKDPTMKWKDVASVLDVGIEELDSSNMNGEY